MYTSLEACNVVDSTNATSVMQQTNLAIFNFFIGSPQIAYIPIYYIRNERNYALLEVIQYVTLI